jgi:NADH dehydrogenase
VLDGQEPTPYRHAYAGSVASLGLHKGVAQVYGVKLKGWPAWAMHRTYHVSRVPTFNRKARVVADWTLASVFRREVISLGQLQDPRSEFVAAATGGGAPSVPAAPPADRDRSGPRAS